MTTILRTALASADARTTIAQARGVDDDTLRPECPHCEGRGFVPAPDEPGGETPCPACDGSGEV